MGPAAASLFGRTHLSLVRTSKPANFDLVLRKTIRDDEKPTLGKPLRYALVVTNEGPANASAVKVTDTLPSSLHYISSSLPGGSCARRGSVVTCSLASLGAGETRTAALTVRPLRPGPIMNTASVRSAFSDRDPRNDLARERADIAAPASKLVVRKTVLQKRSAAPGETVRYRIRVSDTSGHATAGVTVCDRLPAALSYVSAPGARFRRGEACWNVGLLPGRGTRTFSLVARVNGQPQARTVRNVAYVRGINTKTRIGVAPLRIEGGQRPDRGGGVTG